MDLSLNHTIIVNCANRIHWYLVCPSLITRVSDVSLRDQLSLWLQSVKLRYQCSECKWKPSHNDNSLCICLFAVHFLSARSLPIMFRYFSFPWQMATDVAHGNVLWPIFPDIGAVLTFYNGFKSFTFHTPLFDSKLSISIW